MTNEKEWHNGNLLVGDVLQQIKTIPKESVDCCISSPPYWGLRDYGTGKWVGGTNPNCEHLSIKRKTRAERKSNEWMEEKLGEGTFGDERQFSADWCPECRASYEDPQWGLERDFHTYLDKLDKLMVEMKRILKKTGSAWINLGDCYGSHRSNEDNKMVAVKQETDPIKGYEKSRIGIPERFYIRCIDAGWTARNSIVWAKSNAMPTSVKDRFQNKWESIFFFVKSRKYYFDLDAVRERPLSEGYRPFNRRIRDAKKLNQMGLDGAMIQAHATEEEIGNYQPGERSHFGTGGDIQKHMEEAARKMSEVPGQTTQDIHRNRLEGKSDWPEWNNLQEKSTYKDIGSQGQAVSLKERMATRRLDEGYEHDSCLNNPLGKNPGDIFNINPKPFIEAHFATFPLELPEKIIRCACPPGGVVFDPFMGAGTVALAALNLNRKWLGIEINPDYVDIIRKRLLPKENVSMDSFV